MHLRSSAVIDRASDGDFELARQIGKFRVEGGPLADDLAVKARVFQFILGDPGQMISSDVADAVAAGLDGVHFHCRQIGQNVRGFFQLRPVILDVLAGGEVTIILIVAAGDMRQHPQLPRRQQAVWNGDPQHRRMALDIKSVHQPQRAEFIVGQLAGQIAPNLTAKLGYPLVHERLIIMVVLVHGRRFPQSGDTSALAKIALGSHFSNLSIVVICK